MPIDTSVVLLVFIIFLALVFDFVNGFHDAANSIATVVSTRVLTPRFAVIWAGFFNFLAVFGFGTHVARTIGAGMIHPQAVTMHVILAGLVGAVAWDLITWHFGLPTSSSHALIGGLVEQSGAWRLAKILSCVLAVAAAKQNGQIGSSLSDLFEHRRTI
jgi:PiT family inorganic phosphate transporter